MRRLSLRTIVVDFHSGGQFEEPRPFPSDFSSPEPTTTVSFPFCGRDLFFRLLAGCVQSYSQ